MVRKYLQHKSLLHEQKDYNKYPFRNLSLSDMQGEKWRDIPRFEGYIKISNFGRVWSLARPIHASDGNFYFTKERIRKQYLAKYYNSYTKDYTEQLHVHLRYEGKSFQYLVNRLVYHFFVKPIDFLKDRLLIVHKDGDNCNNHFDNLIPMNGTQLYAHGLEIERLPRSGRKIKKGKNIVWSEQNSPRPIVCYTLAGKKIKEYESVEKAAKALNTSRGSIRNVLTKRAKQLHGFVYRYKGDTYKGEHKNFSWEKIITQYSLEGKSLSTYPSVKKASAETGIDADTISKCARGKHRLAGGYIWRYLGGIYKGEYQDKIKNKARAIVQYSLEGKKIARFSSINQACRETGFTSSCLLDCAHQRTKVSHGFVWRFEKESYKGEYKNYRVGKPVTQFTLDGKTLQTYPTIEAASKATGLTPDNIQKNVKGENKTAGGFIWRPATSKEMQAISLKTVMNYERSGIDEKEIVQYTIEGKKIAHYSSIASAAKVCTVSVTGISVAMDKPNRSAAGFVWRSKGRRYSGELAKNPSANKARVVTQYSLAGKKIKVFKSIRDVERKTGIPSSTISAVAKGKFKTTGGFIWKYGDSPKKIDIKAHHASTQEAIRKVSKPVIKYSLDGKRVGEYPSITGAARQEGISMSRISSVINGKSKSAVGHYWELKQK